MILSDKGIPCPHLSKQGVSKIVGLWQNREMKQCPHCQSRERQNKAGFTEAGSQRYRCMVCGKKYTPEPKERGYSDELRRRAVERYVDGNNLRRTGRQFGVSPQSVANWVKAHAAQLPPAPQPEEVQGVEMDELHTFIECKKTKPTL